MSEVTNIIKASNCRAQANMVYQLLGKYASQMGEELEKKVRGEAFSLLEEANDIEKKVGKKLLRGTK